MRIARQRRAGDAPEGRRLLQEPVLHPEQIAPLIDSAYQDNATWGLAKDLGMMPVVPPDPQRCAPWTDDKQPYRKRNRIGRLFRRLKAWRRVVTRYDEPDHMFAAFITVVLIAGTLRSREQALEPF